MNVLFSSRPLKGLLLLPLATLFLLSACSDDPKPPKEIDPAFRKYISGYTSRAISRTSSIRVRLLDAIENEQEREALLEKDLFTFDPSIEGSKEWEDSRTIAFVPDEPLPSGKEFHAAFQLGKVLKDIPEELQELEFGFRTIQQDLNVHLDGLALYRMDLLEREMVKGILKTADVANEDEVEKALTAIQGGKELDVRWEHDVDGTSHHFTVDSVERSEKADSVIIRWQGDPLGVDKEGRKVQPVPALGDFKVMSVEVEKEPDQHVLFRFSDPLDQNQDLSGIVRIQNGPDVRTSISGKKLKVYPEEHLSGEGTLSLTSAVKNILGHRLGERFEQTVLFEDLKPRLKLLGSGTILPNSKGLHLPFKAVNISAVDLRLIKIYEGNIPQFFQVNRMDEDDELRRVGKVVHRETIELSGSKVEREGQWTSYHLDLGDIIQEKGQGAIYRVELGFPKAYSKYPCGGEEAGSKERTEKGEGLLTEKMGYRAGGYYDHDYEWRQKKDPCHEAYYYGRRTVVSRNVFASNIGLITRKGEQDRILCVANDLRTTEPIAGARIKVLDYQQRSIGVGKTDDKGKAQISVDGDPYLLIAEKDGEKAYLRIDGSSSLSTSEFDVGGRSLQEGLKGFPYTERGVHRPGDSVHLSFILDDQEMSLPKDHPVKLEVKDPRNNITHREVQTQGQNGFYYFPFKTSKDAPTGNWLAKIHVGGATFTKGLRIETIKPNRLKIELDWDREILKPGQDGAKISSSWLHGASAKKLRTEIQATVSEKHGHFSEHDGYTFNDPSRSFRSSEQEVFEGRLDENGMASFKSDFQIGNEAPGMMKAHFTTRVYERSGNSSVHHGTKTYSPYDEYIGLKMPETRNRWGSLKTDRPHTFSFLSVDEKGRPAGGVPTTVKVYRIENDWWYDHSGRRDLGEYIERKHREPIHSEKVTTDPEGKGSIEVDFDDVRWGYYLIRVCNTRGGHCSGKTFTVSRYGRPPEGSGEDASLLSISTDKEQYEVGETATITIPSGGVGRILMSLEDGQELLKTQWLKARSDSTRFSFKVTEEMAPNIYAHATLIQPHGQDKNELPLRLFGIAPVKVFDPKTKLDPEISMPSELAPEESFDLRVSESDGKAMTYSVAIVDEGLLDLTNFETPAPWDHFYAKEAHGVRSWDLYDQVMGARSGRLRNILAVGGGGQAKVEEKGNVDRFKPMVKYLGPFNLEKGATNKHRVKVPNYIGSVRTMVVAGRDGSYGHADTSTPVKEPLMVLSTLPRVLGPKEEVQVPVSVFAMEDHVKNVELELKTNELLSPRKGNGSKTVSFEEPGEKLVNFDMKVRKGIGKGEVKVIATSNGEKATHKTEIEVRNPNPEVARTEGTVLQPGEKWEHEIDPPGMAGTNSGSIEFSSIPAIDSKRRLEGLIRYPHGCVEQVVSTAFPQLYVDRLTDLTAQEKARIDEHIHHTLEKLRSFQNRNGSFSYWPGRGNFNHWGTSYAGHFLLEAEAKGYELPSGLKQNWLEAQSEMARSWSKMSSNAPGHYKTRDLQQAYRLYTLALADEAVLSAMNRLRRSKHISDQAKWRLAAAYYLAGQRSVAKELVKEAQTEIDEYQEMARTYGSSKRDRAMILETLTLMGREEEGMSLVRSLSKTLRSDRWLSTQTTAYTLMAIAKYVGEKGSSDNMSYRYAFESGKNGEKRTQIPIERVEMSKTELKEGNKITVENRGESKLFVRSLLRGKPIQGQEKAAENKLRMKVTYTDLEGNPIDITQLEQGRDFMAAVTVKNPGTWGDYEEMALTRIFPSGWEIRNKRLSNSSMTKESRKDYEDVRDDRVLTYFDLDDHEQKSFMVQLHASYLGRFYMPGVYCEAMYDHSVNARTEGQWVEVVKPGEIAGASQTP